MFLEEHEWDFWTTHNQQIATLRAVPPVYSRSSLASEIAISEMTLSATSRCRVMAHFNCIALEHIIAPKRANTSKLLAIYSYHIDGGVERPKKILLLSVFSQCVRRTECRFRMFYFYFVECRCSDWVIEACVVAAALQSHQSAGEKHNIAKQ